MSENWCLTCVDVNLCLTFVSENWCLTCVSENGHMAGGSILCPHHLNHLCTNQTKHQYWQLHCLIHHLKTLLGVGIKSLRILNYLLQYPWYIIVLWMLISLHVESLSSILDTTFFFTCFVLLSNPICYSLSNFAVVFARITSAIKSTNKVII